jgi:phosphatidylserine/phosphatidylglycerophosphate/cardiolipin synthase-like enzyme
LVNTGETTIDLGGWQLSDGVQAAVLPAGLHLPPQATIWVARQADAFDRQFGFAPQAVISATWPGFANDGDELLLFDALGALMDVLVYENGDTSQTGWQGVAVQRYAAGSNFAAEGQILYRRLDPTTGQIVPDTNSAADWAQMQSDPLSGRKVRYPGWDLSEFFQPAVVTTTATLTIAVAPDNAYETVLHQIQSAQSQLQIALLTFEQVSLAQAVAAAAGRGVTVTVLLEGAPAGGLTDQGRYVCAQIETAGGACYFMIDDPAAAIADRYRFHHAKYIIIDGRRAIISSENLSPDSLPDDDKTDGTWGRRGVLLVTDAPGVVNRLQTLFARDLDPVAHQDIFRWQAQHPYYGNPPAGFVPITITGGITYPVRYPAPAGFRTEMTFIISQSPENSLHPTTGILGLVDQAGPGDTILVQQLAERPHWGSSGSNATTDPNLRLDAYLAAARRGARVRLLLDHFFDDPDSPIANTETCRMLNQQSRQERLDLFCTVGNPAGLGLHNKMVLAEINGRGWVHVGSLNGTELSAKGNREVALQVHADAAYAYLEELFWADWPHLLYLPVALDQRGRAHYPLISEIFYDPAGDDAAEFIELVNPTTQPIYLTGWAIGDAVDPADFEDVRRFPEQTWLPGRETLVIALTASGLWEAFGILPDFEVLDTMAIVPDLIDDPNWGDPQATLQLGNSGDEVILRTPDDVVVDAVAYGDGAFPGTIACALLAAPGHTLERFPYWLDTNDCPADFRDWLFPSPGALPD